MAGKSTESKAETILVQPEKVVIERPIVPPHVYIYLMRHADRVHPWDDFDCPISNAGKARVKDVNWYCNLAFVSTLRRTRETLEASQLKPSITLTSDLIREFKTGHKPDHLEHEGEQPEKETYAQFAQRIELFMKLIRTISTTTEYNTMVIVTHAGVIPRMLNHSSETNVWSMSIQYGQWFRLEKF